MRARNPLLSNCLRSVALALCLLAVATSAPGRAQEEPRTEQIEELRAEIAQLRTEYESRLAALEARLLAIESSGAPAREVEPPETAPPEDELARLRRAAQSAAGEPGTAAETAGQVAARTSGGERTLNLLNPETSVTGNVLGIANESGRNELRFQEFELDLQAALDPYSRMRLTLSFSEEGAEIEEGYLRYASLPGGLGLDVGRFRQQFGALNRQHLHALPQSDYPLVIRSFFGDEGLAQTGLSLRWLVPHPWSSANELTLDVTSGENDLFGGEHFEELAVLAHLKNYWDLSPATYFEWGLSGLDGEHPELGTSRVWGSDFTLHWQPPQRAKYREITWRTEALLSQRHDAAGVQHDAWGAYTYLEGLVRRNLYLGARYDWTEDPFDPSLRTRGLVPYLSWWQSEFVRIRAELQRLEEDLQDSPEHRFILQVTWAAGPHKHETY